MCDRMSVDYNKYLFGRGCQWARDRRKVMKNDNKLNISLAILNYKRNFHGTNLTIWIQVHI